MILVLSGPGGAGKGTVIRRLVDRDGRLWLSRSWTTRARREGEPEDAYTFTDRATFERHIEENGFLEWAQILDEYYGTPVPDPPEGRDVVLEINLDGALQVLERCRDVVCVLLVPPSPEVQAARLRARGDSEEHIQKRLELAVRELEDARGIVDATVVNDDLDQAVDELAAIVDDARKRFDR